MTELESAASGQPKPGGGGSPLTYGKETHHRDEDFAAREFDLDELTDLENSELLGLSSVAPEIDVLREAGGFTEFGDEGLGLAREHRLAPRHRRAVQEFFGADRASTTSGGSAASDEPKPPAKPPR